MTQKFELDPSKPAESQIKKTEFNLEKKIVYIYYHYKEGKITADYVEFQRDDLIGQTKMGNDKEDDAEETQLQQTQKHVYDMEVKCHEQIKEYEKQAKSDKENRSENDKAIH